MEHMYRHKIPKVLSVPAIILACIITVYYAVLALVFAVGIFKMSTALGLVLIFTPLGWLLLIPIYSLWGCLGAIENYESIHNKYEFWLKAVGTYFGAIILSYILLYCVMTIDAFLLNLANSLT